MEERRREYSQIGYAPHIRPSSHREASAIAPFVSKWRQTMPCQIDAEERSVVARCGAGARRSRLILMWFRREISRIGFQAAVRAESCWSVGVARRTVYGAPSGENAPALADAVSDAPFRSINRGERRNVHLLVVIPRVTLLFARGAEIEFGLLLLARVWIEVCGREEHFIALRPKESARRLARSWRDALRVARFQVEHVDLVEWIVRLPLALKDQRLAVRREVTFAAAFPFKRDGMFERNRPILSGPQRKNAAQSSQAQSSHSPRHRRTCCRFATGNAD